MTTLTLVETPAGDWRDRASCLGADPDLFFPPKGGHVPDEAKATCAACPVRGDCLEACLAEELAQQAFAGDRGGSIAQYVYGYRGGTTVIDRVAIHRGRQAGAA